MLLTTMATVVMVVLCHAASDADQAIQIVGELSRLSFAITQLPASMPTIIFRFPVISCPVIAGKCVANDTCGPMLSAIDEWRLSLKRNNLFFWNCVAHPVMNLDRTKICNAGGARSKQRHFSCIEGDLHLSRV